MSVLQHAALFATLDETRHEPVAKRIRARLGGETVVDSTRAVLLWEPRRVVPSYAVPEEDVAARLTPADTPTSAHPRGVTLASVSDRPVLDPSVPFGVHTADGRPVDVVTGTRSVAALRLADPDLAGYVVLDFDAFDAWFEEDEPNVSHPRDPFHRVDVLASSRHVRLELDGVLLAASRRPVLLFETMLPTRYYLPREDVVAPLEPTPTRTRCAYKGEASYWTVTAGERRVPDLAWTYLEPLHEAAHVRDLVCFFTERLDVVVDGRRQERPVTPWS
ncbi:DUF427 domain-containing protein [Pseudonocardia sp. RS11V-5]|uniref:DUF427 domain-containing protein n=1 Tax=Pseudonocardia terrae TaxID=2905831 RepID=UPI001E30C4CF|nr:DUF427 domain-containing protein [Pseudonocardia terrae]MCE3555901.1 DUF427 domain-containing protein [Pseudonocardia terrae]